MNEELTEIICVLDRSGSMESIRDDAIGGFNAFLKDQQAQPGTARLTLVLFDDQYDIVLAGVPLGEALALTTETYVPRGSTALLDAIGRTIDSVAKGHSSVAEENRPGKVIFCILTDGMENASRKYTRSQVFDMITLKRQEFGWEFVFLAANQDAIESGMSMGIDRGSSYAFQSTSDGTNEAFQKMSCETIDRRHRRKPKME